MKKIKISLFLLLCVLILCPTKVSAKKISLPFKNKDGKVVGHLTGRNGDLMVSSGEIKKTSKGYALYCTDVGFFSSDDIGKAGDIRILHNTSITKVLNQYGDENTGVHFMGNDTIEGIKVFGFGYKGINYILFSKGTTVIEVKVEDTFNQNSVPGLVTNPDFVKKYFLKRPKIKSVKRKKNKVIIKIKKQKRAESYECIFYNKKKKEIMTYYLEVEKPIIKFDKRDYWRAKYIKIVSSNDYYTSKHSKRIRIP